MSTEAKKGRTVLVKCLIVNSDGDAVNQHGEPLRGNQSPIYEWAKRYRSNAWLEKYPRMWKEIL